MAKVLGNTIGNLIETQLNTANKPTLDFEAPVLLLLLECHRRGHSRSFGKFRKYG